MQPPEVFGGTFAWLGAGALVTLLALGVRKRPLRPYALIVALPGLVFAILGFPGQVSVAHILSSSLALFFVGAVVLGLPIAGLC